MSEGTRKLRVGTVTSDKMQKTVVVKVDRMAKHPLYGKPVLRSKNYMAHDEEGSCRIGDRVRIEETRPLSRRKRWKVVEIIERAPVLGDVAEKEA
jgi:small subunit ribosomal protein S17